ncbi:hypothetical protein AVEN_183944-1 [Araneus ventricosus]|uniref:Uncharacterized protein n=1 Tax=Araneus ventricosus TaxID=182803 RepID=A0A4Y2E1I6_ARAVE|nr:hypothetical protein AVEN_183944-1 [Araneus ventricosus]
MFRPPVTASLGVRGLNLSKFKSEILASRLQQWNLLEECVRVSSSNVTGVMKVFGLPLDVNEWCLFIDSSKVSLKMVLLHYDNELPSIPIAYAPHMKET